MSDDGCREACTTLLELLNRIEGMPTAPLDGQPEHQRQNVNVVMAKLLFYDTAKELLPRIEKGGAR